MLTQDRTIRRTALAAALFAGLATFPSVIALAIGPEQTDKSAPQGHPSAGSQTAILRGRVTDEAGAPLADVRVRVAIPATDMRFVDTGTDRKVVVGLLDEKPHKLREARSDARGDYRLEIPGLAARTPVSIDAMKPGYRRLVGTLMSGGDPKDVEVVPGAEATASLILRPALYFSGVVVDKQGKPVPDVKVSANVVIGRGSGGIERTASRADGTFELFCYPRKDGALGRELGAGPVYFSNPDYIDDRLKDVYAIAEDQRKSVRVVLDAGHKLAGTVFDVAGKPVPHAMVEAIRRDRSHRKATLTDASGRFAMRGLSDGLTTVNVYAFPIKQKLNLPIALKADKTDLEIRLKPMSLPADLQKDTVLGMQLTDVTPELKSAYDVYYDRGALILDPGTDSDRLRIGELAEGYVFWMVGQKRVGSVREFVNQILAETAGQNAEEYRVRVVYGFRTVEFIGTNTQYLRLKKNDLKQLQVVSDQLTAEPE